MTCPLQFTGSICVPGTSGFTGGSEKKVALQFEQITRQFENVVSTDCPFEIASAVDFVQMPLADELVTVDFIAFLVRGSNQTTIELLVGDLPRIDGVAGTFPTGFSGGESFAFDLRTYNDATGAFDVDALVSVTFTAAAQSAQDVANEINAAVMLAGASTCVLVEVDATSGQLKLKGVDPGSDKQITIPTPNATIGFGGVKATDLGTGTSLPVNGNFDVEVLSVPGIQLWLRGTGALDILLAGT